MIDLSFQVFLLVFGGLVFLFSNNERRFMRIATEHGVVFARRFARAHRLTGGVLVSVSLLWFLLAILI